MTTTDDIDPSPVANAETTPGATLPVAPLAMEERRWVRQVFSDESGWGSFSRLALTMTLLFLIGVVSVDVAGREVGGEVYGTLTTVVVALVASSSRFELAGALQGLGAVVGAIRGVPPRQGTSFPYEPSDRFPEYR